MLVPKPGSQRRIETVLQRLEPLLEEEPYYLWAVPNWLAQDDVHGVIDIFYPGIPLAISVESSGPEDQRQWLDRQLHHVWQCPHLVLPKVIPTTQELIGRLRDLLQVYPPHRTTRLLELLQ